MKIGSALVLAVAASIGCVSVRSGPLRPAAAPVPPSQEIEILDPGQSATGVPEVVTRWDEDGVQRIDVPPTVLVHRFYPSGDRSFQGPMLPGGPTIVTVNHPKTLEREYVTITMPPGAPRVHYAGKAIVYDYGRQSVTLAFGPCGRPRVTHAQGVHAVEVAKEAAQRAADGAGDLARRAGVPSGVQYVRNRIQTSLARTADAVGDLRRAPRDIPRE